LHAHQESCSSIKNGQEGDEEGDSGLDSLVLRSGGSEESEKEGFLSEAAGIIFPRDEVVPAPPAGYRVMFLAFLLHGLSLPAHEFLRGLLFVYVVQLHQLTPNSLLHIACFVTLYEAFLGIDPHWILWKYLFCLRPSGTLAKFLNLAEPLSLCDQNRNIWSFRWLSQYKVGDRSGSTSKTRNPLTLINMGLLPLIPSRA
jgi:hypothetical protein